LTVLGLSILALGLSTVIAVSVPNPKYDFVKRVSIILMVGLPVTVPMGLLLLRRRQGFMRGLEQITADILVLAPLVLVIDCARAVDMEQSLAFICMSLGTYACVSSLSLTDAAEPTSLFGAGLRSARNWRRRLALSLVVSSTLSALTACLLRLTWVPTRSFASLWGAALAVLVCVVLPGLWGYWLFEAALADDVDAGSPIENDALANPNAKRQRVLRVAGLASTVLGVASPVVAVVLMGGVWLGLSTSAVGALLFLLSLPAALARARAKSSR
jgi:hypothetical protein